VSRLLVRAFSISIDGYGAGPGQDLQNPLGVGGTEFRFVTDGIEAALEQAKAAAGGKDVRLGGGVATIRQYLRASLIDELHLAISPVLLGSGEHLLHGVDMRALGYECVRHVAGARAAAHVILRKRASR
jgi:dihydrofolate reductase